MTSCNFKQTENVVYCGYRGEHIGSITSHQDQDEGGKTNKETECLRNHNSPSELKKHHLVPDSIPAGTARVLTLPTGIPNDIEIIQAQQNLTLADDLTIQLTNAKTTHKTE